MVIYLDLHPFGGSVILTTGRVTQKGRFERKLGFRDLGIVEALLPSIFYFSSPISLCPSLNYHTCIVCPNLLKLWFFLVSCFLALFRSIGFELGVIGYATWTTRTNAVSIVSVPPQLQVRYHFLGNCSFIVWVSVSLQRINCVVHEFYSQWVTYVPIE